MAWDELYAEVQNGVTGLDSGLYTVKVDAVRARPQSRLLFIDLEVQSGPLAGKLAQVNLYLPKPGDRNAGFHFRNKIAGFGDMSATFGQMAAVDPDGSNIEGALELLGQSLIGRTVAAELVLRGEDAGKYAGTNELALTKPVDGATVPVAAPAAAPVAAPVAAPAPVAQPVAVAPAPAAAPVADPGF